MTNVMDIKRKPDESLDKYLIRLGDSMTLYDLNWNLIADLMNSQHEVEDEFSESKWRKDYASYKKWKTIILEEVTNSDEYIRDIEDKTIEFQKQKFKFQDQKREYNNLIRKQARFEHLKEEISRSIDSLKQVKPLKFPTYVDNNSDVIANVLWSDFHVGMDVENTLNTYNVNVFKQRFEELVSKTIYHGKKNNVGHLIIGALGDFIAGAIHVSTRVESNEDVIKQLQIATESMSEGLVELSKHFKTIKFINIIGNHSRLVGNKTESIFTENLEHLIPWYMESRLKDSNNIEICKDEDGYYVDNTFSKPHVYVHGDLDHVSSVAKNLPQMIGVVPKYIYAAHIHHETVKEYGITKTITNGSLIGADSYAVSKRLYAEPMQKMHIFNEKESIEYTINITFSV